MWHPDSPGGLAAMAALALAGIAPREVPPIVVEFAGCERLVEGRCDLQRDGAVTPLSLWVPPGAAAPVEVFVDGEGLDIEEVAVQGGRRFRWTPEAGTSQVELRTGPGGWSGRWRLALDWEPVPAAIETAIAQRKAGDPTGALATVESALVPDVPGMPAHRRGDALHYAGRCAVEIGAEVEVARFLTAATEAHLARGESLGAAKDMLLHGWFLMNKGGRTGDIERVLSPLPAGPPGNLDYEFNVAYLRGAVEVIRGDHRRAIPLLQQAIRVGERIGEFVASAPRGGLTRSLQATGRHEEALAILAEGAAESASAPCSRALALNAYAWGLLLAAEAHIEGGGSAPGVDPMPILAEAERVALSPPVCPQAAQPLVDIHINRGLALLHQGDEAGSRAELQAALSGPGGGEIGLEQALWAGLIEARLERAAGEYEAALRSLAALELRARRTLSLEFQLRTLHWTADTLVAAGRPEEAVAAWRRGLDLHLDRSNLVPLHLGRDAFLAGREVGTRRLVGLLLDAGRNAEALDAVRSLRSSLLDGAAIGGKVGMLSAADRAAWDAVVDEFRELQAALARMDADRWKVASSDLAALEARREALAAQASALLDGGLAQQSLSTTGPRRPPAPGEVILTWMELESGWVGFALDSSGLSVRRLGTLPEEATALGGRLLGPFIKEIRRAERITLLPYGSLRQVDIHALPVAGETLAVLRPTAYALDVARAPQPDHPRTGSLVVADPLVNLPEARAEGTAVAGILGASLLLGDSATRDAVLARLPTLDTFHFAGHGEFLDGVWNSDLLLADSGSITASDILALDGVPRRVVLSGCETAASRATAMENLGIAQAFLLAGAEEVVATTRVVPDADGRLVSERFHAARAGGSSAAQALRDAVVALRSARPAADWASFRLLLP